MGLIQKKNTDEGSLALFGKKKEKEEACSGVVASQG